MNIRRLFCVRSSPGYAFRIFFVALVASVVFLGGKILVDYALMKAFELSPAQMFNLAFSSPEPVSATNLQSISQGHSGYLFYLRFNASERDIQELLDRRQWTSSTWNEVQQRFTLENRRDEDRFHPPWKPDLLLNKEVFRINEGSTSSTYLVIDRRAGLVYCTASGL